MHVMKKALLAAALVMASGSALAVDGGHIDFNGMVQSGTCKVGVVDTGMHSVTTDGVVPWILRMLLILLLKLAQLLSVYCRKSS